MSKDRIPTPVELGLFAESQAHWFCASREIAGSLRTVTAAFGPRARTNLDAVHGYVLDWLHQQADLKVSDLEPDAPLAREIQNHLEDRLEAFFMAASAY